MPAAASAPAAGARSQNAVATLTVKFDGTALDPQLGNKLVEAVVKKVRVLPDMAHVVLADPVQTLVDGSVAKLGQEMEILAGGPEATAPKSLFKGSVVAVEPEFRDDGVFIGIRAYDRSHAMTRSKHTRTFQDQTIGDIVQKVARPYFQGVQVEATGAPLQYILQAGESDWDFVWRLLDTIGFEFVSDGPQAKVRRIGTSDGEGPWMQYGQSENGHRLFSFRPRLTGANLPEKVKARYVNTAGAVVSAEASVVDGRISTNDKSVSGLGSFGELKGSGEVVIRDVIAKDESELRRLVEAKRDKLLASAVEAEGVADGNPDLRPGVKVDFRGLGKWSGKYLLSECVHVYRGGSGYRTRFHIAARPKSLLAAVAPAEPPAGKPPQPLGLVQGEVTNINDPESLGRVRVRLPTLASDPESGWARIATTSAGKERGLLMLPQVGDKVIVGFENGDARKPFILGSVWDGKAPPGKDVVQDDGSFSVKSDKRILMKAKEDFEFVTEKAWTGKAQKAVTFENAMDPFTIKSGKEIVLKAPKIRLEADMAVEIKASQVKVNGNATLELKAPSITIGGGQVKLG